MAVCQNGLVAERSEPALGQSACAVLQIDRLRAKLAAILIEMRRDAVGSGLQFELLRARFQTKGGPNPGDVHFRPKTMAQHRSLCQQFVGEGTALDLLSVRLRCTGPSTLGFIFLALAFAFDGVLFLS